MDSEYPSGRSTHGVLNGALWGFAIAFSLSAPVAKKRRWRIVRKSPEMWSKSHRYMAPMAFNLSHVGDELVPKEHWKPFFGLGSGLVLGTFVGVLTSMEYITCQCWEISILQVPSRLLLGGLALTIDTKKKLWKLEVGSDTCASERGRLVNYRIKRST